MQTLNEIISDLQKIARDNNYEGATIDGIIYMAASGIYKNQLNVLSTALEISPSTCTLTNSAIQHAQDKNYSVYRGKNQHILLKYVVPNETKSVKKYDICTRIGKYKLLYARDYDFESGTRYSGDIELILCEKLIEETLSSTLRKYTRSSEINLTEDLDLYVDNVITDHVKSINISLGVKNYINQTCNTPYLILTDTDYGVICWCYDKDRPDLVFDSNFTYKIKSPQYLEETIEMDVIQSIPGFDISETLSNAGDLGKGDGIRLLTNLVRETNVDNINIEASSAEHSGNIIRSITDIKNIFLSYFAINNIKSCKSYFEKNEIHIVYLLKDKNMPIPQEYIDEFLIYLEKAYYVDHKVIIEKAWGYKLGDYSKFTYDEYIPKNFTVTLEFDSDIKTQKEIYTVKENELFTFPSESYVKTIRNNPYKFMGWKDAEDDFNTYAITGKDSKPATILITKDTTFKMVWREANFDDYKIMDLYTKSDLIGFVDEKDFYQRLLVMKDENSLNYVCRYEPVKPIRTGYAFMTWTNNTTGGTSSVLSDLNLLASNNVYSAGWNIINYSVQLIYTNNETKDQLALSSDNDNIVRSVIVKSGDRLDFASINQPDGIFDNKPSAKLVGFYVCDSLTEDLAGEEGFKRYKFDMGTPILRDNLRLVAMYELENDLDMTVYFDAPLNNTELHNFVDNYSYDIGEVFEPMKVTTQMSKTYKGISWINLNSFSGNVTLPRNAYFDFSYKLTFSNTLEG